VVTPWAFRDGEAITVYVERDANGLISLTDRGAAAQNLLLAGVDMSKGAASRSWNAVKATLGQEYSSLAAFPPWEIGVAVLAETAGRAVREIAEVSLRADGLRDFAPANARRGRLDSRVIAEAGRRDLTVIPRAKVNLRGGAQRPVSLKIEARTRNAYVQTLTRSNDPWGAFDKARSLFESADIPEAERVSVIATDLELSPYQRDGIKEVSTLVPEHDIPDWLQHIAA
jgi:hypothetical protein